MKRTAVLITATLFAVALKAQQETPQGQQAQSEKQPTGQQASPAVDDPLEDDPGFKRLSPAQQDWVRKQVDNIHKALEETRRDMTREQAEQMLAQDQALQQTKQPARCIATFTKKPGWFHRHFHIKPRVHKGQTSSSRPCPPRFIPGKP